MRPGVKTLPALLLLGCLFSAAPADTLGARIGALIRSSPVARTASWGVQVVNLGSGAVVFQMNPDHLFVPASNTKLFTTALALSRLGPEYRFRTTVLADRQPSTDGRVQWLRLVGAGDPNLSARVIPYQTGPATGDPLLAIEDLADQVVASGVRRVDGDIIGDDTAYIWEPYPEGWAADDPIWEYGAPVSALAVNDNFIALRVHPGEREGDPAGLTLSPPVEFYEIDNRVRTVATGDRKIYVDRQPGSGQLRVWGTIPLGDAADTELLGISDPAAFAARALQDALARKGVEVRGSPLALHRFANQVPDLEKSPPAEPPAGFEVARRLSAPLLEDLRIINKVSQNLHAEMALRAVGRATRNVGSRQAGLAEMTAFLKEAGIEESGYDLEDGSGLTRLNLVSPATVVKLLRYQYALPARDAWLSLLPLAGQDGTLSYRFHEVAPARVRIRAKTGSLSHVAALSGYLERRGRPPLCFSILVNNFNGPASEVRGVIDRICMLLVK